MPLYSCTVDHLIIQRSYLAFTASDEAEAKQKLLDKDYADFESFDIEKDICVPTDGGSLRVHISWIAENGVHKSKTYTLTTARALHENDEEEDYG